MDLSLGFLFCSIDLYFCLCASTILSWWLWLCSRAWSQTGWFLQFHSSFSRLLWLFEVFCISIQIVKLFFLFFFLIGKFLAALGLHCCIQLSPLQRAGATLWLWCMGFSLWWPLLLCSKGSWWMGSVVVGHGPSCPVANGIFPDQGSNPCPLHWQADS